MALTENKKVSRLSGSSGLNEVAKRNILDTEKIYCGGINAVDYLGEVQPASDTLGLRVIGLSNLYVDNSEDGKIVASSKGIYLLDNSSTYPLTRTNIGQACYVEDDQTVAGSSTNLVVAGIVHDVESRGVWVDMRANSLAIAREKARNVIVDVTDTTATLTAEQMFAGNVIITAENSSATTLTFPSCSAGFRIGVQRLNAGAGYDVILQAGAGDSILGSAIAGTASNTTDATSEIIYIESVDDTDYVLASPVAKDRDVWVASS